MKTLDDYAADLPTTLAVRESVPDSASDCSDVDEPKLIARPQVAGPSSASSASRGLAGGRTGFQLKPHSIVKAVAPQLGSSGSEQTSSPEDQYYAVQWYVYLSARYNRPMS